MVSSAEVKLTLMSINFKRKTTGMKLNVEKDPKNYLNMAVKIISIN